MEPPYTVRISGLSTAPKEVCDEVELVSGALVKGRIYRKRYNGDDVDVSVVPVPAGDGIPSDDRAAKIRTAVAAVQYEGEDPKLRLISDNLRRQMKLPPYQER